MGRTLQRQAQGPVEAAKAAIRAEDMEKGIFTTVSQLPQAGAAQGHRIGQRRSLTITVQRRDEHEQIDLHPLRGLLHPRPEAVRAAGGPHRQVWPYAATIPEGTPAQPYSSLILSEKLYPHLLEIDRAARERMDAMLPRMMEAAGVHRGTESPRPDGLGGPDEHAESAD